MTLKEIIELLGLRLVVMKRNFVEYCKVIWRYYGNKAFRKADLALLKSYIFRSPYKISKQFLINQGAEDVHVYGETPLTTLEFIAAQSNLKGSDTVYELGCGRGRSCFWLNAFIGCRAIGIEYIPQFVEKADNVKKRYNVPGVEFYLKDILEADLEGASVIYLYGTCYDDTFIQKLIKKFEKLPPGTKIITVSYPLSDYTKKNNFELVKVFSAEFTWGEGDVYLQVRK